MYDMVKCPYGSNLSGAAVCAMILGKSLAEVLDEVDWRELTHIVGIQLYLGKYDLVVGLHISAEGEGIDVEKISSSELFVDLDLDGILAILQCEGRMLLWTGDDILDPCDNPEDQYDILGVVVVSPVDIPLTTRVASLPADWKDWRA